jgi:hypothetical protein
VNELNPEHISVVNNFLKDNSSGSTHYMLTIARDGESPDRSIYHYDGPVDVADAYNKYTDWGFAKEYLTVTIYGPGGQLAQKVLRRSSGGTQGDCTFVREDYIKAEGIILKYKGDMQEDKYKGLVKDFAKLFSRDNIRFDVSRFFKATECEEVFE